MARDRLGSDYSENMSDVTTCSCMASSIEKCSVRSCGSMFQEPFFLHPPGSRPRDGLYINPMNSPFQSSGRQKDTTSSNGSESFYLHSPHDLVYTRITHLFDDNSTTNSITERTATNSSSRSSSTNERKDDTLTVKVDVHINNGTFKPMGNGSTSSLRSVEIAKDGSGSEHAYEQICIRQDDHHHHILHQGSPKYAGTHKKLSIDNGSDNTSRSRKTDRRYSRSSSASESSNMSSEVHCYSSTTSTPSLSRNSSNERISKSPKVPETLTERKNSTTSSTRAESEKETKIAISGPSIFRPPPPPPPPPPEIEEVVIVTSKVVESTVKEEKKDGSQSTTQEQKCEATITTISANSNNKSTEDTTTTTTLSSCFSVSGNGGESNEVTVSASPPLVIGGSTANNEDAQLINNNTGTATSATTTTTTTACQVTAHLVNRHMVLPFIPPKFANQAADSDTLLKPSEYLRSICKTANVNNTTSLSKARSVDNLDIQGRVNGEEETVRKNSESCEEEQERNSTSGPPPPPLPPPPGTTILTLTSNHNNTTSDNHETTTRLQNHQQQQQQQQPLATISIQDLTSVQLRRTNIKMHATKTFSAPPNRSVSMTNVSEAFFVQKTDLIAELKKTKDIPGIKKLKVQRAQVEKSQEQNLMSEINKAFSISNFVDQIPEKDSSGNVIPIWKRQMLARKAAERAKKELEEQIARENEEKRQKAIPPWKRQLLAKKDSDVKATGSNTVQPSTPAAAISKIEVPIIPKKDQVVEIPVAPVTITPITTTLKPADEKPVVATASAPAASAAVVVVNQQEQKRKDDDESDNVHIIPWRAQLRKTNSKLNILD